MLKDFRLAQFPAHWKNSDCIYITNCYKCEAYRFPCGCHRGSKSGCVAMWWVENVGSLQPVCGGTPVDKRKRGDLWSGIHPRHCSSDFTQSPLDQRTLFIHISHLNSQGSTQPGSYKCWCTWLITHISLLGPIRYPLLLLGQEGAQVVRLLPMSAASTANSAQPATKPSISHLQVGHATTEPQWPT